MTSLSLSLRNTHIRRQQESSFIQLHGDSLSADSSHSFLLYSSHSVRFSFVRVSVCNIGKEKQKPITTFDIVLYLIDVVVVVVVSVFLYQYRCNGSFSLFGLAF